MGLDMLSNTFADELTSVAAQQLSEGLRAKQGRMEVVTEIMDLYNNKTLATDAGMVNIPFPFLSGHIDQMMSKIDDPPSLTFKVPNRPSLSDKVQAAWVQESSSTRSGWKRKDRAEKKMALLSGRGICKVFASSVNNDYRSHYELVDPFSFVADPTRGFLEDGNYHGETDIFKTRDALKRMASAGIYDSRQVARLLAGNEQSPQEGDQNVTRNKFDRLKALGMDVESTSFAGQRGFNMTEWAMRYDGEWFYLLFEPRSLTWVRAERMGDVFGCKKTPFVSWAANYDEYSFWTKGSGDDIYPITEALRLVLNTALENEKRRGRPMRMVESGALVDVNELQDYVPDNVILTNPGKNPNVVTIETPDTQYTVNLANYLDGLMQSKTGVTDPAISETDKKVGVFYGQLQQEADRVGLINKEYSESYAHKGYRFCWGLKEHLTKPKQVEMLGKSGVKLRLLDRVDFADVDDVDDVTVAGGSKDAELTAVESQKKSEAIASLSAAYPDKLNPDWVVREQLQAAGYDLEAIEEATDASVTFHKEAAEAADSAIQQILLNETPRLYMGADRSFADRILRFVREELDYVKLDKNGNEAGIDRKVKEQADRLMAYVMAHVQVIAGNAQREVERMQRAQGAMAPVEMPVPGEQEQQLAAAMPGEGGPMPGTPEGTQSMSAGITSAMS